VVWTIIEWVIGHLLWEAVLSLAAALGVTTALKRGLGLLPSLASTLWFGGSMFVAFLAIVYAISWKSSLGIPDLRAEINWIVYAGEVPPNPKQNPVLAVAVTITNAGTPSIANGWSFDALIDGHKYVGALNAVPDEFAIAAKDNSKTIFLGASLMDRAANRPIPFGGQTVGVLLITFPKLEGDFFKGKIPTFTVHFKDARAQEYSASFTIDPENQSTPLVYRSYIKHRPRTLLSGFWV
jgi:hypothetical protein